MSGTSGAHRARGAADRRSVATRARPTPPSLRPASLGATPAETRCSVVPGGWRPVRRRWLRRPPSMPLPPGSRPARATRHRQDPPGHRTGDLRLPGRPPGAVRDQPPSGSPGWRTPITRAGCRTSCAAWAATRCWSSMRSAASRSSRGGGPVLPARQQPLRTRLAHRHQQQALRTVGRDLRRRGRRCRDDRPARPPRRGHRPRRATATASKTAMSGASQRARPTTTDRGGRRSAAGRGSVLRRR